MKISKPRREIYKEAIRSLMAGNPRINNIELSQETGLHRNTVTRLIDEIRIENEVAVRERWKMLLNDVTDIAKKQSYDLGKLWHDHYHYSSRRNPSQLVSISKAKWMILKDLYSFHLAYMGIRRDPKSLIQINLNKL